MVYCFLVFGSIGLLILVEVTNRARIEALEEIIGILAFALNWAFVVLFIADIVLLLLTGCMVAKLFKSSDTSDHAWFDVQKER